jgi:putative DNA primase/helicase
VPWHTWTEYQTALPSEDDIRSWWRVLPTSNVGCALGPVSGIVRLDIEGAAAHQQLREISGGDLPETLEFKSGRRDGTGKGILWAIRPGVTFRTTGKVFQDGELRFQAQGAQTVLPPSRHRDGALYCWLPGSGPGEIQAALAPAWAVKRYSAGSGIGSGQPRARAKVLADGERIGEHRRNTTLTSLAGTMRRRGFSKEAIEAALFVVNEQQCDPPLSESEVEGIARSVARYAPSDVPDLSRLVSRFHRIKVHRLRWGV